MARVKQFADDLGISKNRAQSLINKGRSRKDGGSQILENVMADKTKTKDKKKKKKEKKIKGQMAPYIKGGRARRDDNDEINPQMAPYIKGGRARRDDNDEINPQMAPYIKAGRAMADGGSNVTKINKGDISKAKMGQFTNIKNDAIAGKISPEKAEKMIRKLVLSKKDGGGFPDLTGDGKVTKKDILKGRGVPGFSRGGGMAIQGLGFKGVR